MFVVRLPCTGQGPGFCHVKNVDLSAIFFGSVTESTFVSDSLSVWQ